MNFTESITSELNPSETSEHCIKPQELQDARRGYAILNERKNNHKLPKDNGNSVIENIQIGRASCRERVLMPV